MLGTISGILMDKNKISFIVTFSESDGGLVEFGIQEFKRMAKKTYKELLDLKSDLHKLNGRKCFVNLLRDDKRIIEVTGIQ